MAMLSALMSKRAKLQEELRSIERQVRASPVSMLLSGLLVH
jgi:hypothetical protein